MTRLTTRHLLLPTLERCEPRVRRVREGLELIFVAVFTSLASDVVFGARERDLGLGNLRRSVGTEPTDRGKHDRTNHECFNKFGQSLITSNVVTSIVEFETLALM